MNAVVGVCGCVCGWVAIELSNHGFHRARSFGTLAELLANFEHAKVIAVAKNPEIDVSIDDARIHEIDPEVSFRVLNGDIHLLHGKHTWNGMHSRRRHLANAAIVLPDQFGELDPAHRVGVHDILDAAIAAWSARRIARGQALA